MHIRISGIVNDSVVDGPGLRLAVFAQGCPHNCKACHNPQTHDFKSGYFIQLDEIVDMAVKNPLLSGVTLSGGEPFMQVESMAVLAQRLKKKGLNIIVYTGFLWEEIMLDSHKRKLLESADYIVDGKFELDKRTLDMPFVGSSNQRIIDVKKSIFADRVVVYCF